MKFWSEVRRASYAIALLLAVVCGSLYGQGDVPQRKFDEFEELRTSDVKARLDLFAIELNNRKDVRGYIVGYRPVDRLRGAFLRTLNGYKAYLVNSRGVPPDRIAVADAMGKGWLTELWLVPHGATPFKLGPIPSLAAEMPLQFDGLWLGPGCEGEYSLVLEDPKESVEFFAESLRFHSSMKAYVVMHPSTRGSVREAQRLATVTKQALMQKHGIPADRIVTSISSPRRCLEMNYWLVPPTLLIPAGSNPEVVFQSAFINYAEQREYTTRRVEFSGNERTRDQILRRRILLQEGDLFTRALLRQSLESLSRFRGIRPVSLVDVEVNLSHEEKLIDLTLYVNERRRN